FCTKKMQAGRLRSQLKYFLVIYLNLKSKITKSDFSVFSVSSVVNKKIEIGNAVVLTAFLVLFFGQDYKITRLQDYRIDRIVK
ncbi:MAG: hypothetical protein LBE18_12880, partial [Planctomycetaceae bacterium]|nr:hypothetical protein [Planctomycetaceae bacterium]